MRYAEILLTYAEAKIELNQIDNSVISAIDLIRSRAGQPGVISSGYNIANQFDMKRLIRRERNVELCGESFRYFDIRRWKIAEYVVPGKAVGAVIDPSNPLPAPNFKKSEFTDLNSIADYSAESNLRITKGIVRVFEVPKHYLFPIPQNEIDMDKQLTQNSGWN